MKKYIVLILMTVTSSMLCTPKDELINAVKSLDVGKVQSLLKKEKFAQADLNILISELKQLNQSYTRQRIAYNLIKLTCSSLLFNRAFRCVKYAFEHNLDIENGYKELFWRFYRRQISKFMYGNGTCIVNHLPLIAISGAILALSGVSILNAIKNLLPSDTSKNQLKILAIELLLHQAQVSE